MILVDVRRALGRATQCVLGARGFGAALDRLQAKHGAVVLMYHSVAEQDVTPWIDPANHVPSGDFERQMQFLKRNRNVISVTELVDAIRAGRSPACGSVVVTFDDGYRDNLTVAAPILDRHGVCATVYLATGYVDRGEAQWIDRAYAAFRFRSQNVLRWPGPAPASYGLGSPFEERRAYRAVCRDLLVASPAARRDLLALLERELRPESSGPRLTMTWDEVRDLRSRFRGIELGGHTVEHVDMTACTLQEARREASGCMETIERETGQRPRHFSFPYGRSSSPLRELVRELGFESACSAAAETVLGAGADPLALGRVEAPRGRTRIGFVSSCLNRGLMHRIGR